MQPADLHECNLLGFRELFLKLNGTLYKRAIARRDEYTSKIREAMKLSSDRKSRKNNPQSYCKLTVHEDRHDILSTIQHLSHPAFRANRTPDR
ncbi:hypothetical protein [Phormidium tenue]|uniref:Uncharacterized protein n=1 Tax=Phormidium tenue FACHB-1050 TaxID=2692857 RepID=A0ABR8CFG3_9CYAN|nr:hypothetical protein [Phormidium tenue]MBD2319056.1 hypothetical protein [Phormidium tenue FACHB-1050]